MVLVPFLLCTLSTVKVESLWLLTKIVEICCFLSLWCLKGLFEGAVGAILYEFVLPCWSADLMWDD